MQSKKNVNSRSSVAFPWADGMVNMNSMVNSVVNDGGRGNVGATYRGGKKGAAAKVVAPTKEKKKASAGCFSCLGQRRPEKKKARVTMATLAKEKMGAVACLGRYHNLPRVLQDDYITDEGTVLGDGVNGSVFLAESKHTGIKFAVKPIKMTGLDHDLGQELINEVTLSLCLDNPFVGRVQDIYEGRGSISLVMEVLEGGDLSDRLMEVKRFTESDSQVCMDQMLRAIKYLHAQSIVHRDVKLENFMYTRKGGSRVKLIDLGFSRYCAQDTSMERILGTVMYMAPEVLEGSYDARCDVWSLGVAVHALLIGKMPFHGANDKALMHSIKSNRRVEWEEKWKDVSAESHAFVMGLLQKDPERRTMLKEALMNPWISKRPRNAEVDSGKGMDQGIVDALFHWETMSHFRRACMRLLGWSLTYKERLVFVEAFLDFDQSGSGSLDGDDFEAVLVKRFGVSQPQSQRIFRTMQSSSAGSAQMEINYTNFLAAAMSSRIVISEFVLGAAFNRFEPDQADNVSREKFERIIEVPHGFDQHWEQMVDDDADRVSRGEFMDYIRSGLPSRARRASCTGNFDLNSIPEDEDSHDSHRCMVNVGQALLPVEHLERVTTISTILNPCRQMMILSARKHQKLDLDKADTASTGSTRSS